MAEGRACVRETAEGVLLRVRVTPRSSRDEVAGIEVTAEGPALKVRVRAVPEDGAANAAVAKAVADWLDVAKSAVAVTAGHKSRVKTLSVAGAAGEIAGRARRQIDALR